MKELESSDALQDEKDPVTATKKKFTQNISARTPSVGVSFVNNDYGEGGVDDLQEEFLESDGEMSSEAVQEAELAERREYLENAVQQLEEEVQRLIGQGAEAVFPRQPAENAEQESVREESDQEVPDSQQTEDENTTGEEEEPGKEEVDESLGKEEGQEENGRTGTEAGEEESEVSDGDPGQENENHDSYGGEQEDNGHVEGQTADNEDDEGRETNRLSPEGRGRLDRPSSEEAAPGEENSQSIER